MLLCPYLGRGEYGDDDWKQRQGNHQPLSYSDVKNKIKNPKSHRRQTTRLFYKRNWGLTRYQCVLQARQDWSSRLHFLSPVCLAKLALRPVFIR